MGICVRNLQAMCTVRGNNGGTIIYAAADKKGPLFLRQLWNVYEVWASKAADCHVSALLEAEVVVETHLRSVRETTPLLRRDAILILANAVIILPRQARDKHRERKQHSKKSGVSP